MDLRVRKPGSVGPGIRAPEIAEAGVRRAGDYVLEAVESSRPAWSVVYEWRRRAATTAVALLALWLLVHVVFGANGMVVYSQKRAEHRSLQNEIDALQKENDLYQTQIKALKNDSSAIEKEAREQLHYARPGEVVYISPAPPPASPPASVSAKKR